MNPRTSLSFLILPCALLALLGADEPPQKLPPRVAPIYSMPNDGSWVEYAITYRDRNNKEFKDGKMWISSVGQKRSVTSEMARWIEIKIEIGNKNAKDGKVFEPRFGKMLVAEKVFSEGRSLEESVLEAHSREGMNGPVLRMTGDKIADYFTMGIRGELVPVQNTTIETKLGKFQARQVSASGRGLRRPAKMVKEDEKKDKEKDPALAGDVIDLEYRAWLSSDLPFGLAKFEVWAKKDNAAAIMIWSAEAVRHGAAAKSEFDENKSPSR